MIGELGVAFKTRKPLATAFEFDGDNVEIAVIMGAAGLGVEINTIYNLVMDYELHQAEPTRV